MDAAQIKEQLQARGLMATLYDTVRAMRPTLAKDTVYRAFNEPDTDTPLLRLIRSTALNILNNTASTPEEAPTAAA